MPAIHFINRKKRKAKTRTILSLAPLPLQYLPFQVIAGWAPPDPSLLQFCPQPTLFLFVFNAVFAVTSKQLLRLQAAICNRLLGSALANTEL